MKLQNVKGHRNGKEDPGMLSSGKKALGIKEEKWKSVKHERKEGRSGYLEEDLATSSSCSFTCSCL